MGTPEENAPASPDFCPASIKSTDTIACRTITNDTRNGMPLTLSPPLTIQFRAFPNSDVGPERTGTSQIPRRVRLGFGGSAPGSVIVGRSWYLQTLVRGRSLGVQTASTRFAAMLYFGWYTTLP